MSEASQVVTGWTVYPDVMVAMGRRVGQGPLALRVPRVAAVEASSSAVAMVKILRGWWDSPGLADPQARRVLQVSRA